MIGTFRTRLAATVVVLVVATAALVAGLSYALVQRSLRSQLVDAAVAQADFNIGVLASTAVLPDGSDAAAFEASGLGDRIQQRGAAGLYVEFAPGAEIYASDFTLVDAGSTFDAELRSLVAAGRLGYEFVEVAGEELLVVGGRRPPAGPDFYFFFSAAGVAGALAELQRVLVGAGVGVAVLGALIANLVARRVLRPVDRAGVAAQAMAAGDLSVRLPVESGDEFGRWAQSFNDMAASLQARIDELQEARRREERFVADVSHELRTPLTALVAEADLLRIHLADMPPAARRVGELLSADVDRLRRLVQDLLEVSRLEASPPTLAEDLLDVTAFLTAVIADRDSAAELHSAVDEPIVCDRRGLERIVGNLLENAARHAPGARVVVAAELEDGELAIAVADEGPGVPDAALPLLFERFYSVDEARRGGSGLGLAIARQHAIRLGGTLAARHNSPHGLVFELCLPVTRSLPGGDPGENRGAEPGGETADHGGGFR